MKQVPIEQSKATSYRTYLLTCWQERDGVAGTSTWRFRLEAPGTGRRRLFANLEALVNALQKETDGSAP